MFKNGQSVQQKIPFCEKWDFDCNKIVCLIYMKVVYFYYYQSVFVVYIIMYH
jgi:hypothetical protein